MARTAQLAVLLSLLVTRAAAAQSIEWVNDYQDGMRQARDTGRPVMIDFWASWCRPCIEMDRDVYPAPALGRLARRFVFVRLNFDRETILARKYRVYGIPMMVFTDSAGHVLASHLGYATAERLVETMERIPESFEPVAGPLRTLAEDPDHFESLIQVARFYASNGLVRVAKELYVKAAETAAGKNGHTRDQVQLGLGVLALLSKDGREAEKIFESALEKCEPASRELMLLGLVRARVQRNRTKEARTAAEELERLFPGSASARKAQEVIESRQWNR